MLVRSSRTGSVINQCAYSVLVIGIDFNVRCCTSLSIYNVSLFILCALLELFPRDNCLFPKATSDQLENTGLCFLLVADSGQLS